MITFGEALRREREARGITQTALARAVRINQPRISKIETDQEIVTLPLIKRLATALGTRGQDLVADTNREDDYLARALSPEDRAKSEADRRRRRAVPLVILTIHYRRVFDLFEAIYGGMVAPPVRGEDGYVELVDHCRRVLPDVAAVWPRIGDELHFPDHLEVRGELDLILDDWREGERALVMRGIAELERLCLQFTDVVSAEARAGMEQYFKFDEVDARLAELRNTREKVERAFLRSHGMGGPDLTQSA
jgi:transcriptional regulator with XRE-family HTH domain